MKNPYAATFLVLPNEAEEPITVSLVFSEPVKPYPHATMRQRHQQRRDEQTMLDAVQDALATYFASEVRRA